MQYQLNAVDDFHRQLQISPMTPWCKGDAQIQAIGRLLSEAAEALTVRVKKGDISALRAHLLAEELGEFFLAETEEDALDALTDLDYVLKGTHLVHDWPAEAAFSEVQRANMTKKKKPDDPLNQRIRDKGDEFVPPNHTLVLLSRYNLEAYRKLHQCCPICLSDDICHTTMAVLYNRQGHLYDRNRASCSCGWAGIVHHLVRKTE